MQDRVYGGRRALCEVRSRQRLSATHLRRKIRQEDRIVLHGYYDAMRTNGHPFDMVSASKYNPLTAAELRETPLRVQAEGEDITFDADRRHPALADVHRGYDPNNRAYTALKEAGTLIDCKLVSEDLPKRGIKYSCWDLVPVPNSRKTRARSIDQALGSHRWVTSWARPKATILRQFRNYKTSTSRRQARDTPNFDSVFS